MEENKILVVGSGFMGSGIMQTALQCRFEVTLYDITMKLVEKSKVLMIKMLEKMVANADIVIKAVAENTGVKGSAKVEGLLENDKKGKGFSR